ncbi:MAG TPA: tol-pal system protein YbgF [Candidatus Marinimicrobia bacterium]|nr:MAG: tol-pal system protein YbgF [Candidatus Marinimicrobia bacterium CG_4_9_14_3_um_filter_48_9]HCW77075.1 tol-pal system protein YbgF [Candidatus Neomarinimicrobiota bacterium]
MNRFWKYCFTVVVATTLLFSCAGSKPSEPDPVQEALLQQLKALSEEIGKLQTTQGEILEMKHNLAQMDSQLTVYQTTLASKEQDSKAKESEIIELRGNIDVLNSEIILLRGVVDTLKTAKDSLDQRLQVLADDILPKLAAEQGSPKDLPITPDSANAAVSETAVTTEPPAPTESPKAQVTAEVNAINQPPLSKREYRRQYNAALNKYFQRDYQSATGLFAELITAWPDGAYADNCQYWIGECYYSLENYQQAIEEFSKVSAFPENNKADHALFKIGMCYLQIGNRGEAETLFRQVLKQYPESDMVPRVKEYFAGKKL